MLSTTNGRIFVVRNKIISKNAGYLTELVFFNRGSFAPVQVMITDLLPHHSIYHNSEYPPIFPPILLSLTRFRVNESSSVSMELFRA